MIRRFFIYLKSDGFLEAIKFSLKAISSLIYRKSQTYIYHKRKDAQTISDMNYDIRQLSIEDVENTYFPRLKLLPYKKWLDRGSKLYMIYMDNNPAGFSWLHFSDYPFAHGYKFQIKENECWVGPQFIHKNFRGKSLQRIILAHNIGEVAKAEIYTSVNINNVPSNKSVLRNGFEQIGMVNIVTLFGRVIKTDVNVISSLQEKIYNENL